MELESDSEQIIIGTTVLRSTVNKNVVQIQHSTYKPIIIIKQFTLEKLHE